MKLIDSHWDLEFLFTVPEHFDDKKKELRALQIEIDKMNSLILAKKLEYHGLQRG